ncbi:hypothetical protein CAPTEDRAFT_204290 [Capitella teleta]|uniref:Uncharacterized protein n=1 Tax=Capitella teleta TaxID=283909 RepID=R7VFB6_CAPTE|nr:hypothetical protein CAPTEDRAFT_204290 [Capitella teleta]|eukprot:ELU14365.1 hypothetical protein CAPTEDRAFT_204290 [Capitella teleta]
MGCMAGVIMGSLFVIPGVYIYHKIYQCQQGKKPAEKTKAALERRRSSLATQLSHQPTAARISMSAAPGSTGEKRPKGQGRKQSRVDSFVSAVKKRASIFKPGE